MQSAIRMTFRIWVCWTAVCLWPACADGQSAQKALTPTRRIELFDGKDFSGWSFCMSDNADPAKTWSVTNGVIHCTGKPTGYLRTDQAYRDFRLTVEWRFVKVAPRADNGGVLVDMQLPDKVWPQCLQCQGKHQHQGDMFVMSGVECKQHRGMDANTAVPMHGASNEKPIGKWNTCQIVCDGATVTAFVNGKRMNQLTECTVSSGFVGFQSEGAEFEVRKVYLEPLEQ